MDGQTPTGEDLAERVIQADADLGTPVESYPTLADLLVHTAEVGRSLGEVEALYTLSVDAGLAEHRPALASRKVDLVDRAAECFEEIRRRCVSIESVGGDMTEVRRLRDAVTPDDAPDSNGEDDPGRGGG